MKKIAIVLNIIIIASMILIYANYLFDIEISRMTTQVHIEKAILQALVNQ